VKGFADACRRGEEDIAEGVALEGVACHKDGEGERRHKEVIASLVRVELRQLQKDIIIISLSLTSVFASLSFV
jgi:hypothetical protein